MSKVRHADAYKIYTEFRMARDEFSGTQFMLLSTGLPQKHWWCVVSAWLSAPADVCAGGLKDRLIVYWFRE